MAALLAVADAATGHAATMSCPATMDMATGQVSVPSDWLMLPNFFPPDPLQLPLYSTAFDSDGEFDCLYQAGPKLLGIWRQIPKTCRQAAGPWRESGEGARHGWTCIGPAENCTFECD
jgi:hypothetical protein